MNTTYDFMRRDGRRHGIAIEEGEFSLPDVCLDRLFRVHVGGPGDPRTVFLEANSESDAQVRTIQLIGLIDARPAHDIEVHNGLSAAELMTQGASAEPMHRLFEVSGGTDRDLAWVDNPLFLVPNAKSLIRLWAEAIRM